MIMYSIASSLVLLILFPAVARDNGQWGNVDPGTREWFNKLASKNGLCCSFADGVSIDDPDWRLTAAGGYQVFYKDAWRDVPPEAVIGGGNRIGHAVLWPIENAGSPIFIRCFMPGAET